MQCMFGWRTGGRIAWEWKELCGMSATKKKLPDLFQLLEIKTDGEPPEGAPKNVRVSAVSVSDIQVTWSHPDRETWHSELLLGYYVGYKRFRLAAFRL